MMIRRYKYLFIASLLIIILIFCICIKIAQEKPPVLLNIDDPQATFTIQESIDGQCLIYGNPNNYEVNSVIVASRNVDLKKYIGQTVKLKGEFIFSSMSALNGCSFKDKSFFTPNDHVILDVTDVLPI